MPADRYSRPLFMLQDAVSSIGLILAAGLLSITSFGCRATDRQPTAAPSATASRPASVAFYPKPPAEARIVALPPITGFRAPAAPPGKILQAITGETSQTDQASQLIRPVSLAVRAGQILVCDTGRRAIVQIDPQTGTSQRLTLRGVTGPLDPVAIAADAQGNLYIADAKGGRVLRIGPDNTMLQACTPDESTRFVPIDLAVSQDRLYVINRAARRVETFDLVSGSYRGPFGGTQRPGAFPVAVCLDAEARVYVVDMVASRVRVYDAAGTLLREFGARGDRPGLLAQPRSVAVGPDGIAYVSDAATQLVQAFSAAGAPLMYFGGADGSVGGMNLPAKVITDRSLLEVFRPRMPAGFQLQYMVFVTSQMGPGRIGVYGFGQMPAGETPSP